jgi:hypothetical protein
VESGERNRPPIPRHIVGRGTKAAPLRVLPRAVFGPKLMQTKSDMNTLKALDSVITAYAYENATTALGVLEGRGPAGSKISTEMLCTLDNFIKVVLFSDNVYIHPSHAEIEITRVSPVMAAVSTIVSDYPSFGAGEEARLEFDGSGIFHLLPLREFGERVKDQFRRTVVFLNTIKPESDVWCVLNATWPNNIQVIWQEMLVSDLLFIDEAISCCGLQHFKPVFPGEHLYLGLRNVDAPYQMIGDIAMRRLRDQICTRLRQLNEQQTILGASPLPVLPPIFVSRLVAACGDRRNLSSTLFKLRMSDPFRRFRDCIRDCHKMLESEDVNKRSKVGEVIKMLNHFEFPNHSGAEAWVKHGFKAVKAIAAGLRGSILGPLQEIFELSTLLFKVLSESALSALNEFNVTKKADPIRIDAYLRRNFGDCFDLSERHFVATLLSLPETAKDWQVQGVSFAAGPGRLNTGDPPLGRAYRQLTQDRTMLDAMLRKYK